MTRVLWINPVGTDMFDEAVRSELESAKRLDTELEVRSLTTGPHHLEYHAYVAEAAIAGHGPITLLDLATMPLVVGALLGLPVVDADGMGRAFPELQMETFHVYGVAGTPMAITNEYGDTAIVTTHDNRTMEWLARGITIRMGGASLIAEYAMDGATAKRVSIPGTISLGVRIGRCLREARARHEDPFEALIETLRETHYAYGRVIFAGKVTDVFRRTTEGFAKGTARIESAVAEVLELTFQNEHLVARVDGEVRAIVPDLISVLEAETAEPITTEAIRYGQRVQVMAVSTPPIMRTPEALAVFGPAAFGLEEEFHPIEELDWEEVAAP